MCNLHLCALLFMFGNLLKSTFDLDSSKWEGISNLENELVFLLFSNVSLTGYINNHWNYDFLHIRQHIHNLESKPYWFLWLWILFSIKTPFSYLINLFSLPSSYWPLIKSTMSGTCASLQHNAAKATDAKWQYAISPLRISIVLCMGSYWALGPFSRWFKCMRWYCNLQSYAL